MANMSCSLSPRLASQANRALVFVGVCLVLASIGHGLLFVVSFQQRSGDAGDMARLRGTASPPPAEAPKEATMPAFGLAVCMAGLGLSIAQRRRRQCSGLVARGSEAKESGAKWNGAAAFSGLTATVPEHCDNVAVSKILPHRYPFLLVDKVVEFEPGKRAVGIKNVTANEPQFTGHFPDRPIMPGVLMVEAMAQLGGIVCLQEPITDGKGEFFFAGIDGVKFRRPVVPGDTLVMEMELKKFRPKYGIAKMTGKAFVNGEPAVEVKDFTFAFVKPQEEAK